MRRTTSVVCAAGLIAGAAVLAYHTSVGGALPPRPVGESVEPQPKKLLPLAQVILFNSGVGYFQREGTVEGDARVDLAFPASDINDLLKSLVLRDLGQGRVNAVSYDSQEPIERTLKSFALDLTGNPTLGQILNQARGEKVEVKAQGGTAIIGVVVGMEAQVGEKGIEAHQLNLHTVEGLRNVPLASVQRIRFLNAALDAEFRAALNVLAATHDSLKKSVSLQFQGVGKRQVQVGYVVESPIWKTSYRLVLDKHGKLSLQCWAMVENTTDEDWKDVRLALVGGRPLSFQMNLYQSLYVPRPKVEPELFASLRPPVFAGAMVTGGLQLGGMQFGWQGGGQHGNLGMGGNFQGAANLGVGGGQVGLGGFGGGINGISGGFGGFGLQGGVMGMQGGANRYQNAGQVGFAGMGAPEGEARRLTYQELQQRRQEQQKAREQARQLGRVLAAVDPKEALEGGEVGEAFEQVLEQKVSIVRQKSALLPILTKDIPGQRVSIFNETVHARTPLQGLKFKNGTGQPLVQGPVMVYESERYAGDARILDLQPDEERLLAYAMDLGVEVKTLEHLAPGPKIGLRMGNDDVQTLYTARNTRTYVIRNRTKQDRAMIIEHAICPGWKLSSDMKPTERTRDLYRFETAAPAGKTVKFEVAEEQDRLDPFKHFKQTIVGESVVLHFMYELLGLEIERGNVRRDAELTGVKIAKGKVTASYRDREQRTYKVRNISKFERDITLEHQAPELWRLVTEAERVAGSADRYVFTFKVPAGQAAEQGLIQEGARASIVDLIVLDDTLAKSFLTSPAIKDAAKAIVQELLRRRTELDRTKKLLEEAGAGLKTIIDDQSRLRANLERLPPASAAYKRYLEKFDTQETRIEKLQEEIHELQLATKKQEKGLADYAIGATTE